MNKVIICPNCKSMLRIRQQQMRALWEKRQADPGSKREFEQPQARTMPTAGERWARWEKREVVYLRANYKTQTIEEMATHLGRTFKGVRSFMVKHRKLFPVWREGSAA